MSIKNFELVRDALSLINVYGPSEAVEPEHSEFALRKLNQVMADMKADGIDLQFYDQTMDDLGSTCPLEEHAQLAVTHYVAIACAPHFAKPISQALSVLADKYYSRLVRDVMAMKVKAADITDLPLGEGWLAPTFDIGSGNF